MARPVTVYTDERMLDHDGMPDHPEAPARLVAILRTLRAMPPDRLEWRSPAPAPREVVRRAHTESHVAAIDNARGRRVVMDIDTATSPGSVDAAYIAAGAAVDMVEALTDGDVFRAFAAVRPPGHHAESRRAMGFCLFNNIAIAAAHAIATKRAQRVLIIDWDVHHGNGTQEIFQARDDVYFFSTHESPNYPGTGRMSERGSGPGRGFTTNVELPAGAGDDDVTSAYAAVLPDIAARFRPELILVSAGYDAHADDPLSELKMSVDGFATLTAIVRDVAEAHTSGRFGLVLEGGYNLSALAACAKRSIEIMSGGEAPPAPRLTPLAQDLMRRLSDR